MPQTPETTPTTPRGAAHDLLAVLAVCVGFTIGAAGATGASSVIRELVAHADGSAQADVITTAEYQQRRDALTSMAR